MIKQLLLCYSVLVIVSCSTAPVPVKQLVADPVKWDKKLVMASGYLCVDPFTVYLASSTECDELQEERANEFKIFLWLEPGLMKKARTISSGSKVVVYGEFEGPPPGTIKETVGELAGYSVYVTSIALGEP